MYHDERPCYTLNDWCREHYGEKLYKISLNIGLTCPNRDGTLGTGGCIFCSAGGSGEFSMPAGSPSCADGRLLLRRQLDRGRALLSSKRSGMRYIAYFQAYTNTYGPVDYLESMFSAALAEPDIAGISIATRPDCLPPEVLTLLSKLKKRFPDRFIWTELGLQTIHEQTARYLRRGYPLSCFDEAVEHLHALDIPVITHIILGLPGENREMLLETVRHLNRCGIQGVKLQLLHILEGTDLAADYRAGRFQVLTQDAYLELLMAAIAALSPYIVIHRVTGDGPKELLIAPEWSRNKRGVLNALYHRMKQNAVRQGCAQETEAEEM